MANLNFHYLALQAYDLNRPVIRSALEAAVDTLTTPPNITDTLLAIKIFKDLKLKSVDIDYLLKLSRHLKELDFNIAIDEAKRSRGRVQSSLVLRGSTYLELTSAIDIIINNTLKTHEHDKFNTILKTHKDDKNNRSREASN